jgi:hypothetical protein
MEKNNKEKKVKKEKNWDKKAYLNERLLKRPRSFYIDTGDLFLKISLVLASCSLIMALYTTMKVYNLPNHASYYINSVNGKIYENRITPEKLEKMRTAMAAYRAKQNEQATNNK